MKQGWKNLTAVTALHELLLNI